jgi:hypothetical protein
MRNEPVETYRLKDGGTLEIHHSPENPYLETSEHDTFFVCAHRRYSFGDFNGSYEECLLKLVREVVPGSCRSEKAEYEEDVEKLEKQLFLHAYVEDVYLFEHSGLRMNTSGFSDSWDSGKIGLIAISKKKAREIFGKWKTEEKAIKLLKAAIQDYNAYVSGECYGWIERTEEGEADSCWGYIGDYMKSILPEFEERIEKH